MVGVKGVERGGEELYSLLKKNLMLFTSVFAVLCCVVCVFLLSRIIRSLLCLSDIMYEGRSRSSSHRPFCLLSIRD